MTTEVTAQALPRDCTFAAPDWSVLARCWHPVAQSAELGPERPLGVRLLDQRIVLYRAAAGLAAANDLCAHRGAPLSDGCIRDGLLACPYHGYRYDANGRCVHIPAHPGAPVPGKLALRKFSVAERHGLIWVRLVDASGPPLPEFPEFADPEYQVLFVPPLNWTAAAGRQIESFCDVAHFAFVHPVTFATGDPVVPRYEVQANDAGVRADFTSSVGNVSDPGAAALAWRRLYQIHLPFTAHLVVHFPHGGRLALLNAASPVSARRTRVFPIVARNFDRESPAADVIDFQQRVYAEDQRIVERQYPEELPVDLDEEVHVRADRTSVEYRRQLARLGLGRGFTA